MTIFLSKLIRISVAKSVSASWFFGIARYKSDLGICLFVSQDNSLVQKFEALNRIKNRNYSLYSCF